MVKHGKLKIIPLGGLGEVGKNMTAYEFDHKIIIVDAGIMFPENDMLGIDYIIPDYEYVRARANQVIGILITHGHLDHISCNHQYEKAYLHPADEAVFIQHSKYDYRYMLLVGMLTEAKLPSWLLKLPIISGVAKKFSAIPEKNNRSPLSDGMRLDLGGRTIEIICTPGHTPGSVCLLDVERRQLFSGDTVCDEGILLNLDHSTSVETFKKSILRLKAASERFGLIWPAHHALPLDHSWLDEYIQCADQILEGVDTPVSISSPVGKAQVTKYGRIRIAYRPDHLWATTDSKS